MDITYRETKELYPAELERLFRSVGWESGKYPEKLSRGMAHSTRVISAWDEEKLVGLVRALDDGETVAFVHYLLVDPDYQNEHIGRTLMERLLEQYRDLLYVKIMPSDPATIPFYEKLGFRQYDNYCAMLIRRI